MKLEKETDVTIMSLNLHKCILKEFEDYHVFDSNIEMREIKKYKKIIFFNCLHLLDDKGKRLLIRYLKDNDIKFINITNKEEEVIYTNYLVITDKLDILIEGKTIEVLKESKLLKRLGFNLPFMIDLSMMLKDYGLINELYLDERKLVAKLWN